MEGLKTMNIILVDSVKGGCGKTSISLKCAVDKVKGEKSERRVCYIDLDLLGTSIETFLIGEIFVGKTFTKKDEPKDSSNNEKKKDLPIQFNVRKAASYYLNDLFKGKSFDRKFISDIAIEGDFSGEFSLIACSPNQDDKERFKPSRQINYGGQIDYDYFSAAIEKILEQLYDMKYTYVIIDMPPNSDAYTDSLFNILLSKAHSLNEEKAVPLYNVEIYVVNSFDMAHFKANCEWLKMMIEEHDMKWVVNVSELFKIVFNDIIDYNTLQSAVYGLSNKYVEEYVKKRLEELNEERINITEGYLYGYDKKNVLSSTKKGKIYFDSADRITVEVEKEKEEL